MPYKPKHPCAHPGCPELVPYGEKYCEKHKKMHPEEVRSAASRGYGSRWNKARKMYLAAHPLCEQCLKEGRYVAVEEVHHIVPLADGGSNDESNLMSLCRSCHEKIHRERGDR